MNDRLWSLGPACSFLTAIIGIAVLVGWYMDLGYITAIRADYIPMAPSTALLFTLSGIAVVVHNFNIDNTTPSRIEQSLPLIVFFVAMLLLILSIQHIHSNWEYLGLTISGSVAGSPIGHMSPITALSFSAGSISLFFIQHTSNQQPHNALIAMGLAFAFMLLCLAFFLSYLFGSPLLYDGTFIPPALNTLIGFLLLAIALLDTSFYSAQTYDNWLGKLTKSSASYIWIFIAATVVIISVAYAYQRQHEIDFDKETSEQLTAIAELKSREIQLMHKEWLEDSQTLFSASHVINLTQEFLTNSNAIQEQEYLLEFITRWKVHSSYDEVFIFDPLGNRLISTLSEMEPTSSNLSTAVTKSMDSKQPLFLDFYRNEFNDIVYLALVSPIITNSGEPLGAMVLRIDPSTELYPLIQQWPVVSESAETLLVRQENNEVVFLNDLRFKQNTALSLRHSLDNEILPAVMAVKGFTGIVDGLDYRNIKVIADVRPIPNSPWFMVTRMDRSEVYSDLTERMWVSIVFVLAIIIALGMGLTFLWRQQRLSFYKEHYETALRLEIYGQAFSQNSEGICVTDAKGNIVLVNEAFTSITGYTSSEVLGKNPRLLKSGKQDAMYYKTMWKEIVENGSWQGEIWNKSKSGEIYPSWSTITALYEENSTNTSHYIAVFSDITKRLEDENEIRLLAHYDPLTSLPNRSLLDERIKQSIRISHRNKYVFSLLFIDLDHFKNVNDSLGHHIGDLMLIDVATRFTTLVRDEDTVSRLGGDEYVILLQETEAAGAAKVAQKIIDSISVPFILEGSELTISPSIGIAIYPTDGDTPSKLLQAADSAMYQAKDFGRNQFQFFTDELFKTISRRLEIDNALRGAINRNELELYYQPQMNITSGQLIGCEALLRWKHPNLGQVSPGEFIPIAEDSGHILSIDRWVIFQVARQMAIWEKQGILDFSVAVNLSANQFHHQNLLAMVKEVLIKYNIPANNFELELTEGLMMDNVEGAITIIDKLHDEGIKLSIDDFGTGYSSLSYLKRFKIDKLK